MTGSKNPYSVLGVKLNASPKEIHQAYRHKAKELHPDTNSRNPMSAKDFNILSNAYNLLKNEFTRSLFDQGKIDFDGNPIKFQKKLDEKPKKKPTQSRRKLGQSKKTMARSWPNLHTIAAKAQSIPGLLTQWSTLNENKSKDSPQKEPISITMEVPFKIAARGGNKKISLHDGQTILVKIPPGVETDQIIRLRELGKINQTRKRRDIVMRIKVNRHQKLIREGDDIRLNLPISLSEAVLGAQIRIPTVDGFAELKVPQGANSGQVLRLRGKGIFRGNGQVSGDQLVYLNIQLPKAHDSELQTFASRWSQRNYDPRQQLAT